jgi:hypothetical protein
VFNQLSPARRRARLFAATALVSLTAACGPVGAGLGQQPAGPAVPGAQDAGVSDEAAADDPAISATVAPVDPALPPAPVPPAPVPPVPEPVPSVAAEATEAAEATDAANGVPTEVVAEAPLAGAEEPADEPAVAAGSPGNAPQVEVAPPGGAALAAAAVGTGSSSGGSGGSFTDQSRSSFTAANGQTGRYLRYAAGIDPSRAVGLVVYVDGTGEYGIDNPTSSYALGGSAGLVAVDRARNLITVAVESPNQSCECWHTGDTSAYADFLAQLIEQQLASYPITDVWLAGFSSGSQEITRFLVPRHPELMRLGGGWVVFGGGGPPAANGAAVTAARMAGVRGHWYTGTADTAVPMTASWGAQAGERWYAARGVRATAEYPAGVGHTLGGRLGSDVARVVDGG